MAENTKETMLENEELVTYSVELPKKLVEEFKEKVKINKLFTENEAIQVGMEITIEVINKKGKS